MESLRIGGAEKSLLTILSLLDRNKYDIDLFLFHHEGEFLEQLSEYVNLLDEDNKAMYFQKNFKSAWFKYLKDGDFKRFWHSFLWLIKCFLCKYIYRGQEYYGWKHQRNIYSKIDSNYDVAIGFLEKKSTYFTVDQVNAVKKYAFMHTDYDAIPHDEKLDGYYYKKMDGLAVVSEHTAETMLKHFSFLKDRIYIIKNIVSSDVIKKMALDKAPEMELEDDTTFKICTVGRLTSQKGIDIAIEILKMLGNEGNNVEWFVLGDGEDRVKLKRKIKDNSLEGKFHLLGSRSNPYPYMASADIYVQPSRWEGYGITVAEAKVLCKPIVVSDIPEFREQISHNLTGKIAKDKENFVREIENLIYNEDERRHLMNALKSEPVNQNELLKLYAMIED